MLKNQQQKEEITIEFPNNSLLAIMIGQHSINILKLEKLLDIHISQFGNQFNIYGDKKSTDLGKTILTNVYNKLSNREIEAIDLKFSNFETEFRMCNSKDKTNSKLNKVKDVFQYKFETWKKTIVSKSLGQNDYFDALNNYELVFGLGPAGTGKSYLSLLHI